MRVGEDFPVRVRNEKKCYIKYDKLVIDNDIYVYDDMKNVPVLVAK